MDRYRRKEGDKQGEIERINERILSERRNRREDADLSTGNAKFNVYTRKWEYVSNPTTTAIVPAGSGGQYEVEEQLHIRHLG